MSALALYGVLGGAAAVLGLPRLKRRLELSRAKHPSLRGHSRIAKLLARQVPYYAYGEEEFFACDGADADLASRRRDALERLGRRLAAASPETIAATDELAPFLPDMQFTGAYRVPFQFREIAGRFLRTGSLAIGTDGPEIRDLDDRRLLDVGGSYGVNLLGHEFYKRCIERGVEKAAALGPILGPYHPVIADNVRRIREISGLDQVSFHMSGTEAVMQAVRLARYHTRRRRLVMFCGAYHGWWDDVQPGVGNPRTSRDTLLLKDMSRDTLRVLESRRDVACVLVNPLQALHPNASPSSDAMLIASDRSACFDREAYSAWLAELRQVCDRRGIVLIMDEVFLGFRLGLHGAQRYFGVNADMVTWGKTIGGGLPVGVLAGKAALMKRYRDNRPTDICFARGTFNSHPYVMATMNEFLEHVLKPAVTAELEAADARWNERAGRMNRALAEADAPVRVRNLSSVWTVLYTAPSRYNWMFQFYLRDAGLSLSWVGTGRLIFSHDYTDAQFAAVVERFVAAAQAMRADGWWSPALRTTSARGVC